MMNIKKAVCRIASVVCILAFFAYPKGGIVYSTESAEPVPQAAVVSSRTTEGVVYVYVKGVTDITDGTKVQVGNALCEDIQAASVVSTGMPIKTTILLDNSISLSKKWGSQAVALVDGLIDSHAKGEEFRIATFADSLHVVADFSTEYEALKAAVGEVKFLDQDSYLTDILYELLGQSGSNGEANFTRFVIITDGADDNDIKYTQAELSELMKKSGVVIHTAGVKASNNNSLLETLFSYARLTGGTYTAVDGNTDVESVRSAIDEDYSLLCLRLVPDVGSMDGSRKEAKFHLNTPSGEVTLTTSLQMPFADMDSVEQPDSAGSKEIPEPELPIIITEPKTESETQEKTESAKGNIVLFVLAGGSVLIVVVAAVLLIVLKKKKNQQVDVVITSEQQAENSKPKNEEPEDPGQRKRPAKGGTCMLGGESKSGNTKKTLRFGDGNGQKQVRQFYISLSDINDQQKSFRVPIDTRIVIGREEGDILLEYNAAASYRHCEIIKKGSLFYVNDLQSSNGTFYGGMRVYRETPIMSGGILGIGDRRYKVVIGN